MIIRNYTLTLEQAEKIPMFYHPELCESDLPEDFILIEHDLDRTYPLSRYHVRNSVVNLTLRADIPLVKFVDIDSVNEQDSSFTKKRLEEVFGFELVD